MHQSILMLAKQIPACAQTGETLLDAFCTAAEAELRGRLPEGTEAEALGERFVCATALLTAAMCAASAESGSESETLRAGNVSVSRKGGTARAAASALRAQAFALLPDSVTDDGFAFLGVKL